MAGVQPYRYPQAASSMAANMVPAYRYSESAAPDTGNMAAGANLHPEGAMPCPPAANPPPLPYPSVMPMEYFCPRLQIGVSEPVVVTQVLDPHRLFCQLRSMSHEIQRLSECMHQHYEVQKQSYGDQGSRFSLVLGQPCASYGEDGRWHRSLLQEFFPQQQQALVIHVDWGKKEVIPANRLRNLSPEFFRLPVFTIPCTMYGISKVDLNWDPIFVSDVRSLLLLKHVVAKIECYNSYEHVYAVELFAEDGMNLNGLIRMRTQIHRCQVKVAELPPESNTKIPANKLHQTVYNPKYPPVELKTGKFEDALVEFVIDPFNFWVQIEKFAAKRKEMISGLTKLYSEASKLEGIITEPKPGELCCAQYQDLYYRAEVISVDKKQVKVYFLDNGMLETVDWFNIKELPAGFSKLPALANRCCLVDTYPLEDAWSQEAIIAFKMAVTDKKLVIHVVSKDADEYTIELLDQSRIQQTSVGKILAKAGLARFEEINSIDSQANGNGKDAHFDPAKSALNPSASEYMLKVQETAAVDPFEESTETLLYSPYEEQVFEPGTTIDISVSQIDHPGYFWCLDATSEKDLQTLMDAIQQHCMSTNCPYTGDSFACLAKCKLNGIWYRALLTEYQKNLSPTSTVEVLFVDYGNRETVSVSNLRALDSEFLQLKAMAFRCSVYNIISPIGNNPFVWDNKATDVLSDFVQKASEGNEFHCTVYATAYLDNELFNIVDLMTPFSNACKTLVKSGYATPLNHASLAPSVQLNSYYYSMLDIKYGSDEEIFIKHVDSSLIFYGQLTRSGKVIKQISSSIAKFIEKSQKRKLPPITGPLCLAKSKDQRWYRGLILSKDESYQVFFVDFGNIEKVSNKCLLPIPSTECELLQVPMQAIKCSLSDIPSKVPAEIVSWFKDVVLDKALRARVVSKDSYGNLSVELYDGDWQINATIKRKLGLTVPKERSSQPAPDQFMTTVQRDNFTKLPDKTSRQERTTSFSEGKTGKSRESNFDGHSEMGREPEPPRYSKNPTFQNKVENKDRNSKVNDFTSQKKTESVPRVSPNDYQERDAKQSGSKTSSKRQPSAIASVHKSEAKLPVVTLKDIPIRKIFPGMKEHVYISQTNSIFNFYVQVAEDSRLDEITEIINSKMSSFEDLGDEDMRVGNVICAYFPDDGLYYRAMVKEMTKQGLCVEYIDYGNTSILSDCRSYRLPPKCLTIPILCIHCSLNKPENASSVPNLEEKLAEFSKRTSNVRLDCEFLKQDGLKWDVILKDELGCINDLLNEEQKNVEEAKRLVMKMKIAREEETSVESFTWNLPPPRVSVKVYISTAESPDNFWCQLSSADMDALASQVQEAGEQGVKNAEFIGALKIGSPCNVMFSEDHNWYRAIITKMDAELVTVRFIDYGNEDSVGRDQIRKLPEPLVNLPPQSFLCCLANFDMKEGTWSSEGKQYFYEHFTEDALELMIRETQESELCRIPMAIVTVKYKELNINEEMKIFWQSVKSIDLELDDLSSIDLMKADQPRTSLAGEDHPLQKDEIGDEVHPYHGDEQESETDEIKDMDLCCDEHVDLDEEVLEHAAPRDGVPLGREDFGSDEVNDDMADDVSPNLPVPSSQGAEVASDHSYAAHDQFPDLTSALQQEPSQDTPESVERLILYFNEKLGLTNKGTISDNAVEKAEVRSQSEISVLDAGNDEKFEDCTKDETKQDLDVKEAVYLSSECHMESKALLPTNGTIAVLESAEIPHSDKLMEKAAFSEMSVTNEEINECKNTHRSKALEEGIEGLEEVGEAALSIATHECPVIERIKIVDEIMPLIHSGVHNQENITNEKVEGVGATVPFAVSKESKEDITEDVFGDGEVSQKLLEIEPEDVLIFHDEPIQENVERNSGLNIGTDYKSLVLGHVDIVEMEDSFDSVEVKENKGSDSEASIYIEAIRAEDFSGHEERLPSEVSTEYLATETEEDLTSFNISSCGEMTTKDYEEVIQLDDDVLQDIAIKGAYMRFKSSKVEGSLSDFCDDLIGVEPVSGEDLKCEAAVDVFCESFSTDCSVQEEPEITQRFMEIGKAEGCDQYVKPVEPETSKGFVQSKDHLTSSEFHECEVATTIDFEEVIPEVPSEVSTEYLATETEEDSTSFNISSCGEMTTKDYEEVIQLDDDDVLQDIAIKGAYMRFKSSTVEGSLSDFCDDLIGEEPVSGEDLKCEAAVDVFCESFSTDCSVQEEPEIAQRFMEIGKAEGCDEYVKPVEPETGKGFVQSKDNLTSSEFNECEVATTIDFEEVIPENEEAIEKDYIRFEGFEATIFEGSLTDFGQDFVSSTDEELVSGEDLKLKYICEEIVVKEDIERKAASFFCESLSSDDRKGPEFVQELMESGCQVVNRGSDVCVQKECPFPAHDTDARPQQIEQDWTKQEFDLQEAEVVDLPSKGHMKSEDLTIVVELEIEEPTLSNFGMEKITFSEVNVTSEELKECQRTCESIESLDKVRDATLGILAQEGPLMETIQIADEIVPLLIRDVHKMENTMVAIEVDMENKVAVLSEDNTVEDIVGSTVSVELLETEPEDVLILQDEAIQEDVESYGGLNICQDDMPLGLGHVDMVEIEDCIDSVAWTEGEEGPASKDGIDIEAILAEGFSGHETVSGEVSTEYLVTITSEDSGQNEDSTSFDITECGEMTTKDYEEESQADEDFLFPKGANKDAGVSFEEFESTIVEGSLTDFSQDFAASAGEELLSDEDLKLKDMYEKFVDKEDLKREAASFEDFLCEAQSSNDHEEPEFVHEFMESSLHHVVDCGRDVCDQSEHPLPADDTERKQQEPDQGQALAGIMAEDLWEPTAEDVTSERDGQHPESFSRYRECPTLLASMDSVYESDVNEPLEKTDSESEECHSPGGSAKDRLWSYFSEARFSVQQTVEPEDLEECGDNTLSESICQTDDCETETANLGDQRDQAAESQRDAPGSVEAELSPVIAAAAEEGKK